jgi:RNA polymerase sigma-70 factor (ECF subfamily)
MTSRSNTAEAVSSDAPDDPRTSAMTVDEARLRGMIDEYFDAVYYALRRVGVPTADLEDCTQEVFIVASDKLHVIIPGRERAFLLGVALRVAAHARRRLRRFPMLWDDENAYSAWEDPSLRPDEEIELRRQRRVVDQVLKKMPEDLRNVFILFEIEELTMLEIASALELPTGTVASRLRRAREEFAKMASRVVARSEGGRHA